MSWEFPEYPVDWRERSNDCKARDNYRCVRCGKGRSEGYILHAHHIVSLSCGGDNSPSNLETLCENCHSEEHPHMQIRHTTKLSEGLKKVPEENRPLKRIDIDYSQINNENIANLYSNLYGGYFSGFLNIANRKKCVIYISHKENEKQAEKLIGLRYIKLKLEKERILLENNKTRVNMEANQMDEQYLRKQEEKLTQDISNLEDQKKQFYQNMEQLAKSNNELIKKIDKKTKLKNKKIEDLEIFKNKFKELDQKKKILEWYNNKLPITAGLVSFGIIMFIEFIIIIFLAN